MEVDTVYLLLSKILILLIVTQRIQNTLVPVGFLLD